MVSNSTSTLYPQSIVLPSIHEMFPEHLMACSAPHPHATQVPVTSASPRRRIFPRLQPHQAYSFDVLKSHPHALSLQHIASSRPRRSDLPMVRTGPSLSSGLSDGDAEMGNVEHGGEGDEWVTDEGNKHACPTCGKRFNRPSSLEIHLNTHTGATPFRCPHPSCGREFNVKSNMRRHFRKHSDPAFPGIHSFPSSPLSPVSPASRSPSASWSVSSSDGSVSPITPFSARVLVLDSAPVDQSAYLPGARSPPPALSPIYK
ncbi:hypothetical protein B0H11DRAFT_1390689 [Mycena galericulata]|nr:hypothetical protein B0H11DRAFT_1390689 [Mycena galericulata]